MSNIDTIEIEGASVEEATREALEKLAARDDEVTIEVLATARAGVLGLGRAECAGAGHAEERGRGAVSKIRARRRRGA